MEWWEEQKKAHQPDSTILERIAATEQEIAESRKRKSKLITQLEIEETEFREEKAAFEIAKIKDAEKVKENL